MSLIPFLTVFSSAISVYKILDLRECRQGMQDAVLAASMDKWYLAVAGASLLVVLVGWGSVAAAISYRFQ